MKRQIDMVGMTVGKLTVVSQCGKTHDGKTRWLCDCACGRSVVVTGKDLRSGHTKSCGCLKLGPRENSVVHAGEVYGRWTVLERASNDGPHKTQWLCRCSCGIQRVVLTSSLRSGKSQSCGCLNRDIVVGMRTKHGGCLNDPEYTVWRGMKQRCRDRNQEGYANYGDRGVSVCADWLYDYARFLDDMGPRPGPEYTLERKDNDGPYCKDNCVWATRKQQNRNKRSTIWIVIGGERRCLGEWAEVLHVSYGTLYYRVKRGLDPLAAP